MIRFFSSKILFVLLLSQFINADKIPELYKFIDSNGQYFLTIIKEEGSKYDEDPEAVSYTHLTLPTNREV